MDSLEKNLETDIQHLATEVQSQRERPEMQNAAEQELIKEAIRAFPEVKNVVQAPTPAPPAANTSPLPGYAQGAPAEVKLEIEYLLDIALRKGIGSALTESQKSPAFVQDAFHDALAGRLYPELRKRGIVK